MLVFSRIWNNFFAGSWIFLLAFQDFRSILRIGSGLVFKDFGSGLQILDSSWLFRIGSLSLLKQRWKIPYPKRNFFV